MKEVKVISIPLPQIQIDRIINIMHDNMIEWRNVKEGSLDLYVEEDEE